MTAVSNSYPTEALRAADAAHHIHPFSDTKSLNEEGSRIITRADGVWLTDSDGNRILDGMAGLWCVQVGHGRQAIADAVHAQMSELSYYNTFFKTTHPPAVALAERLAKLAPPHLNRVFFCSSGSEANDTVFRMVRHYWDQMGKPDKKVIISRWNGYHGSTLAGTSLGGMKAMHTQGDLPVPGVHHINQPYWFGEGYEMSPEEFGVMAARDLERAIDEIGEDKVAAFIAEPIQGAGGVIIPPETYWPEVKRILDERDILFVADEVICGFGRLGEWFGSQYYGLEPDLMAIAKGLTSGYLPMGGVLVSDKVSVGLIDKGGDFNHGYTYSGHPACAAAALANLDIIENEHLVERVKNDIGPYLQERWIGLGDHPLVGQARMKGLMGALEIVPDKKNPHKPFKDVGVPGLLCRDVSFEHGMVMRAVRDSMIISPPLVLSHEEADHLVATARKTLDDTHQILKRNGFLD
ncbi:putrescine aminotransferase [Roseibium hamelinense]|uniref:Putrescine aminotransferase n=1 Tax=Roseibium hamelinense TaxID=150831 RepID=A0A562T1G7_9HYPH|nr:aspartate aminotransferase family protein [Roseibium hamelinense]MTI44536.1 aspartate aminotransferase family protein [Roseibium hamelinense]TWI87505.1 putrescine aminotransferase [Roseibium hamelinense]